MKRGTVENTRYLLKEIYTKFESCPTPAGKGILWLIRDALNMIFAAITSISDCIDALYYIETHKTFLHKKFFENCIIFELKF